MNFFKIITILNMSKYLQYFSNKFLLYEKQTNRYFKFKLNKLIKKRAFLIQCVHVTLV